MTLRLQVAGLQTTLKDKENELQKVLFDLHETQKYFKQLQEATGKVMIIFHNVFITAYVYTQKCTRVCLTMFCKTQFLVIEYLSGKQDDLSQFTGLTEKINPYLNYSYDKIFYFFGIQCLMYVGKSTYIIYK